MNLQKYPLEKETESILLTRLMEECGEIIQAAAKLVRFKRKKKRRQENLENLFAEINDVELIAKEVKSRWLNQ
jgi:NTP pyrophosphatase (non-canonical NTP hydrolase)